MATGSITGQVLDQRNGQPIGGASLHLTGEGIDKSGSSGDDGMFQFDSLAPGNYELTITMTGYENGLYGPLVVIENVATNIIAALQPSNI